MKLGEQAQVQGTPSMFINGTRVANPTSFEAIAEIIEAALKGASPG
jgi:protein-disulfide isomerase